MMAEFFQLRQRGLVFLKDLHLLASLYMAHFIVWRTLRRRRKENTARRKVFKLLNGGAAT
jgi:hypothetical protein